MIQHIKDLSKNELSKEGYIKFISLIGHFINKYNWPKQVLDEADKKYSVWQFEDVVLFTHQFVAFIFQKNKLKNIKKIPDEYIEYYFHQIIVSYVSSKIRQTQKKEGISFETVKRIVKILLTENDTDYTETELNGKLYWTKADEFEKEVLLDSEIERQVSFLPKISLGLEIKHYKKHIIKAVSNIFSLTNSSIEEILLIKLTYSLFDQKSFIDTVDEHPVILDIDECLINNKVEIIVRKVEKNDIRILIDYFFMEDQISLKELAGKYSMPKSTIHYKINVFRELLKAHFLPRFDEEGLLFLKKLHKKLDDLK